MEKLKKIIIRNIQAKDEFDNFLQIYEALSVPGQTEGTCSAGWDQPVGG